MTVETQECVSDGAYRSGLPGHQGLLLVKWTTALPTLFLFLSPRTSLIFLSILPTHKHTHTHRNAQNGREAVAKLEAEGLKPTFHQLDIDSADSIEALRKHIAEIHGGLDILVNNAGIAYKQSSTAPFIEQARNTVKTNFTGTLNVARALLPLVRPHGRVVNVSSSIGSLSKVSKELQKQFSSPTLTEEELVLLVQQFVQDVAAGNHTEKGWPNTAYGVSKIGVTALTKVNS